MLNLADRSNSPDHYARGTQSRCSYLQLRHTHMPELPDTPLVYTKLASIMISIALLPFVSVWFQVLFHSPNRGSFHLSIALLSSLSVAKQYLVLEDGPPRFTSAFSWPVLLGFQSRRVSVFAYGTFTLYGAIFPNGFR